MRRALIAAAAAAALCVPLSVAGSAAADSTVKVAGLKFPDSTNTYLTYFGCQDLYHADTRAPQVRIDLGGAPAGDRSFALLMPGEQTAAGPVHEVESVADTTVAGMYARADGAESGVAYVWFVTPGLAPGQVWAGKADLSVGSTWRYVSTAAASYDWRLLDAATGTEVRDGGTSTIRAFTATNGDGPGYMLAGFGCDGGDFSVDALRYGSRGHVTTYDLEGITTKATMESEPIEVKPGTAVKLSGSTRDTLGQPVGAAMVLQARPAGAQGFRNVGGPVAASADGLVHKVVRPEVTTTYRWYVPEEGYTAASQSSTVRVVVITAEPEPTQTDPPATDESGEPSGSSSSGQQNDSDDLEVPPLPTQSPSESPSEAPDDAGSSDSPTSEPEEPTDSATTGTTDPAAGESTDATP